LAEKYKVKLARSKKSFLVEKNASILFTLLDAGIELPFSCGTGLCGSCEVEVLSGIPDHQDFVLTDEEKESNKTMMICCSGSHSDELKLDI
jgi:ferredoxin